MAMRRCECGNELSWDNRVKYCSTKCAKEGRKQRNKEWYYRNSGSPRVKKLHTRKSKVVLSKIEIYNLRVRECMR